MPKNTHRLMLMVVAAGALCAISWAGAAAPPPGGPPAGPPRGGRGRGPAAPAGLGSAMQEMDRTYKALKAEASDPTKLDQSLRDVATMQRDVAISKLATPPVVNRMAAGDKKTEEAENYRKAMNGLLHTLLDLEDAIVAKNADDMKKGFDQVEQIMNAGHAEFRPGEN